MITTSPTPGTSPECHSDEDAHAAACSFLAGLIGSHDNAVCWDATYHLQGHTFVDGLELVVIAPRDRSHRPLVVTGEDWDEIHRQSRARREALLNTCSITDRRRLREATRMACVSYGDSLAPAAPKCPRSNAVAARRSGGLRHLL